MHAVIVLAEEQVDILVEILSQRLDAEPDEHTQGREKLTRLLGAVQRREVVETPTIQDWMDARLRTRNPQEGPTLSRASEDQLRRELADRIERRGSGSALERWGMAWETDQRVNPAENP